jgi:hypothetical protein
MDREFVLAAAERQFPQGKLRLVYRRNAFVETWYVVVNSERVYRVTPFIHDQFHIVDVSDDVCLTDLHDYSDPALPDLVYAASKAYDALACLLGAIQDRTGIPALHTNINSNDGSPGVLERLQALHDTYDPSIVPEADWLEKFKGMDEEGD